VTLFICLAVAFGCAGPQKAAPVAGVLDRSGKLITMTELEQLTKAYADRYMTLMVSACDAIERDNPDLRQRALAHRVKLVDVSAVYDIVTNPDPYSQLLDLIITVTLQSEHWIDDCHADEAFGDRAGELISRLRRARLEIWQIAARVMTQEQLDVLDRLILEWRRDNPDVRLVAFVRFNDFAASRGKSVIADVPKGSGFLAPVDEAKKAVDEVRLFGERAFYMSKRMPFLMDWHVKDIVSQVAADPALAAQFANITDFKVVAQRLATQIEKLPASVAAERAALMKDIDARQNAINGTLAEYKDAVRQTESLARALNEVMINLKGTVVAADQAMARFDKGGAGNGKAADANASAVVAAMSSGPGAGDGSARPPPHAAAGNSSATTAPGGNPAATKPASRPFDIEQYHRAVVDLAVTLREMNGVLDSADHLVASPAWKNRIDEVDAMARERVRQASENSEAIVDRIFSRTILGAAIILAMLFVYRLLVASVIKRRLAPLAAPEARA
jgi:hypothetical protein